MEELANIFASLRADNPLVKILIAEIIPMRNTDTSAFNAALRAWAPAQSTILSPVTVVDQYTGYNAQTDSYDNWHPNAIGEEKMANRWFDALKIVLDDEIPPGNIAPQVNAGTDQTITLPLSSIDITTSVTDDGLPTGNLTASWTQISGPTLQSLPTASATAQGTSTFDFITGGLYRFRLTATDGELDSTDDVLITVETDTPTGNTGTLIGHWGFDEGTGLSAADLSLLGNTGILTGHTWEPRNLGSSVCFDGTAGQQMTTGDGSVPNPPALTIAGWVKVSPQQNSWGWIGGFGDSAGLHVNLSDQNGLTFYFYQGPGNWRFATVPGSSLGIGSQGLRDGLWHHVAGSYDPASGIKLYVDGELKGSGAESSPINYARGGNFVAGAMLPDGSSQSSRNLNGCIDELTLHSYALTDAEIAELAQVGDLTPPTIDIADIDSANPEFVTISGSSNDNVAIDRNRLLVRNNFTDLYWNGSNWVNDWAWFDPIGKEDWTYTLTLPAGNFTTTAWTWDTSNNLGNIATKNFTVADSTPPVVSIDPIGSQDAGAITIAGSAIDANGIDRNKLLVRDNTSGQYWNGSNWVNDWAWFDPTGKEDWTYTLTLPAGNFTTTAWAWDTSNTLGNIVIRDFSVVQ